MEQSTWVVVSALTVTVSVFIKNDERPADRTE